MNWEKILQLDAENLYKSLNIFFYAFLFYSFTTIAISNQKGNEVSIPIGFKTILLKDGVWQNDSTNESYKVTTPKYGHLELKVTTEGYPKIFLLSKFSQLFYFFLLGFIFWQVIGLAKTVRDAIPFNKQNITRIRSIGFALLLLGTIYPFITKYLADRAEIYIQIPDVELKVIPQFDLSYYILALVFFLIAHVFKKGIELREENALTI